MSVYNKCYDARFSSRSFPSATCNNYGKYHINKFIFKIVKHISKILQILHGLLKSSANMSETNVACIVPTVLKTLRKLTRSLRFRIYYYCEPCVANKKQKVMLHNILLV